MNILFTCAGRRTYLLNYFKEALDGEGLIIGADLQLSAPALSVADIKIQVPRVYSENYVDEILSICRQYQVGLLISLNDLELPILSKSKSQFEAIGVRLMISSPGIIDICFDKLKTREFVLKSGLETPFACTSIEEALMAIDQKQLHFPLILKPRWGSGSIGIEKVEDEEELLLTFKLLQKRIQRSILKEASSSQSNILIQQMIEGQEYGLDIMNDLEGNYCAVSVKRKMAMRSGETDKAETVDRPELSNIGKILSQQLKHIGNLDCDIIENNGHYYVIDLNPRFGGGYPFSHQAGVNMPKALIEWAKGNSIDSSLLHPRVGVVSAKCDYLVFV